MKKINNEIIDNLKDIMGEEFNKLIFTYLKDAEFRLAELSAFLGRNDYETARKILHSLKGSSMNIGAESLSMACAKAEMGILENRIDDVRLMQAVLKEEFLVVKQILFAMI